MGDGDSRVSFEQIEIRLCSGKQAFLMLRIERVISRIHQLLRSEILVDGVTEIQLSPDRGPHRVGFLMHIEDISGNVLDEIIVPAIGDSGAKPRKELPYGAFMVGPRLGKSFASNSDIETL